MTLETVLLTGGAGFIGAHVARELLACDHLADAKIVILDDLSGGFASNIPLDDRLIFVEGSIVDAALIDRLFEQHKFRYVYHLAAYAAEGLSHFIRSFNYTTNVVGSVNVVNAAVRRQSAHFVFTSSIAVYGAGSVPMTEQAVPRPEDPYGIAKYAVEMDLRAASEVFGLNYTIFRPHNVYGEYQNIGDRYRNVIGIFMNRIMQSQSLPVFGSGEQERAFTYVGDIAAMIANAPFVEGAKDETFNVGSDTPNTVNELARIVAKSFGVEPQIEYLEGRAEVEFAWADHRKANCIFGGEPITSLQDGIRRMAEWAKVAGPRTSRPFDKIEIHRGLPPSWS